MQIKNVLKNILFCGVVFLCVFFGVTFGDNCDEIQHQMDSVLEEHNQCYSGCFNSHPNCDQACQINCDEVMCESTHTEYNNLVNQHNSCLQTTGVDGPEFIGEWEGGDSFTVSVHFNKHAPGYMGNINQTIYCSSISIDGGSASINEQGLSQCNISVSNITQDSVTINVPHGVCYLGSYSNDAGNQIYTRPGTTEPEPDPEPEGNGGSFNCSTTDLQSSGGCTTYSSDSSWYCSMGLEGSPTAPGLSLYLNHLNQSTYDEYLTKFEPQSYRFSKLLDMYNTDHPNNVIEYGVGFAGLDQVGSLNRLMGEYGLSHSDGCKLGNATLNTYFTANLCEKIFEGSNVRETNETSCENGWEWNTYCCIKSESCNNPANPQTETGICASGFQNNGLGCCVSQCSGEKLIYEPSIQNCKECEEGMIANETHTKCICNSNIKCCGIQLNTVVPFIGDCIELNTDSHRGDTTAVTSITAFPLLMQGLMKILMSAIMVFSFLMVIIAGLMMTTGAFSNSSFSKGKNILKNVIISLILLGCSGLILSLINPSFFGG